MQRSDTQVSLEVPLLLLLFLLLLLLLLVPWHNYMFCFIIAGLLVPHMPIAATVTQSTHCFSQHTYLNNSTARHP
jgi:hypothetical protein